MELASSSMDYETPSIDLSNQQTVASPWIQLFIVAIVLLIALGGTLLLGLATFCVLQGMRFSGEWNYTPGQPGYITLKCVA